MSEPIYWKGKKLKNNKLCGDFTNWYSEFKKNNNAQKSANKNSLKWFILENEKDKFASKIDDELKRQRKIKISAIVTASVFLGDILIKTGINMNSCLRDNVLLNNIVSAGELVIVPLYFFLMEYIK